MKKYYILRQDGSSIFTQPYPEDFVFHCLVLLLDRTPDETYRLCEIDCSQLKQLSLYLPIKIAGIREKEPPAATGTVCRRS